MIFQRDVFRELVHYVCWKCPEPSRLGSVKLNKVLWFSDTIAFVKLGQSITGAPYTKQKFGPVAKPLLPVVTDLARVGAIRIDEAEYFGHVQKQYVSLYDPNVNVFTPGQLTIIDATIEQITEKHTATSISNLTHDDIWKLAAVGEEIPHLAVLASELGKVTDSDIAWARERLEAFNKAA